MSFNKSILIVFLGFYYTIPKSFAKDCLAFISNENLVSLFDNSELKKEKYLERIIDLHDKGIGLFTSDLKYILEHLSFAERSPLEKAYLGLSVSRKLFDLGYVELEILKGLVQFSYDIYLHDYENRAKAISEAYMYKNFLDDLFPGSERPLIIAVENAFQEEQADIFTQVELPELSSHLFNSETPNEQTGPIKRFAKAIHFLKSHFETK